MIANRDFPFGEIQARADMLTPTRIVRAERKRGLQSGLERDLMRAIDNTLENSFPASDPPSWTASVARPAPARNVVVARARNLGWGSVCRDGSRGDARLSIGCKASRDAACMIGVGRVAAASGLRGWV